MTRNEMKIASLFFLLPMVVLFFGCGPKRPSDMPKLFPCTITVTKGGTPVSGANILLFSPQLPGSLATSGQTNAGGVAEIGSSLANYFESGSPAGELTVVIQKTPDVPEELKLTPEEHSKMTPPESNAYSAKLAKAMKDAPKIVPDKLSSPATSPLKVTVAESKTGTHVTFELDDFN